MKPSIKLDYIQRKLKYDDEKFCKKFGILGENLALIRKNEEVKKSDISTLCKKLKLDLNLFLDEESIIYCKKTMFSVRFFMKEQDLINEDYPREENSRYEEKY